MLSFGVFGVLNKTIGDFGVAEAFTFTVNVFIQKLGVGKLYTEKILQYDYIYTTVRRKQLLKLFRK